MAAGRDSLVALIALLMSLGGREDRDEPVSTRAIVGTLDIRLLTPIEIARTPAAAAMGAISLSFEDPDGTSPIFAVCSGFRISPRHVLTAAHCAAPHLVFDSQHVARPEDVGKLRIAGFGPTLRLVFDGQTVSSPEQLSSPLGLGDPAYADKSVGFAVYRLAANTRGAFVDLRDARPLSASGEPLILYAYPNGVPLAQASGCRGMTLSADADAVDHDCDSLTGSSGGLLVSAAMGTPVGLHLRASAENEYAYFQRTGHYESLCELGARAGGSGYNRALLLTAVVRTLEVETPLLWREILDAGTTPRPLEPTG